MLTTYYTLIAAGIGAVVALSTQFLSSFLVTRREKKKLKIELISEERSLAYLLTQYLTIYIEDMILSAYFLKFASLAFDAGAGEKNDMLYKSGNEAIERAEIASEKIRITSANYLKTITHFTNLTSDREKIIGLFYSLEDFKKPFYSFDNCKNITELEISRKTELSRILEENKVFTVTYEKIYYEMNRYV